MALAKLEVQYVPLTVGTFDLLMWHSVCSEGGVHEAVKPPSRRAVLGVRKTRGLVGTSLGFPHIPVRRLDSINIYKQVFLTTIHPAPCAVVYIIVCAEISLSSSTLAT